MATTLVDTFFAECSVLGISVVLLDGWSACWSQRATIAYEGGTAVYMKCTPQIIPATNERLDLGHSTDRISLFEGPWLSSDLWHQKYRDVRNMQPTVLWLTEMACWEPKKSQLWWNDDSCYVFGKWTEEKFPWNNRTDKNVIAQPKMNQPVLSFRKHSRKPKNSVSNQLREDRCWMSVWDRRKCPH